MPHTRPRSHPRSSIVAALAAVGLFVSAWWLPSGAAAAVQHGRGLEGTVLGWTSWYGSYQLAGIGSVWCIDHGLRAPDADLAYQRTDPGVTATIATAIAWAAGRHHDTPDAIDAAAVMLVLHDLRGAAYPFGRLDVSRMSPANLAGFGGRGSDVLARARAIKADALAHASLRWPLALEVRLHPPADAASAEGADTTAGPEAAPQAVAQVHDADGRPVSGITVAFTLRDASTTMPTVRTTDADGTATLLLATAGAGAAAAARATVPDLRPIVYAPTLRPAQRVIRPAMVPLEAGATIPTPPPTTAPPTTAPPTTAPPITTPPTTVPPTTTPPTTVPPTTAPPITETPTTTPASSEPTPTSNLPRVTIATAPIDEAPRTLPAPSTTVALARTGMSVRTWAFIGCGLIAVGVFMRGWQRRT